MLVRQRQRGNVDVGVDVVFLIKTTIFFLSNNIYANIYVFPLVPGSIQNDGKAKEIEVGLPGEPKFGMGAKPTKFL